MQARWKLLGLAGAAGVAATGAVVARNRREQSDYTPDELRERLRDRLADAKAEGDAAGAQTAFARSAVDEPARRA